MKSDYIKQFVKVKFTKKYFPNELELGLFVCSKECNNIYIDTSEHAHICEKCNNTLKKIYSLKYKKSKKNIFYSKTLINSFNTYHTPTSGDYIDDISYEQYMNGDIDVEYVALAVCSKRCGNVQLIVDGSTQVCPKCGDTMFRIKVQKYLLKKE